MKDTKDVIRPTDAEAIRLARTLMRAALADLVGRARETAGTEGLFVDGVDFGIVRRKLRQIGDGKGHAL